MNYFQTMSQRASGGCVVITADQCRELDNIITNAVTMAIERAVRLNREIITQRHDIHPIKDVCREFGITPQTARNWAKSGIFVIKHIGQTGYITDESYTKAKQELNQNKAQQWK